MKKYMDIEESSIIKPENFKVLESKISQIHSEHTEEIVREKEIITLFIEALIVHGKNQNQIHKISHISKILSGYLGLGIKYCNQLEQAAKVYDIGNIMIDKDIYIKEEKLSFEEFAIVKHHTQKGYNILIDQNFVITDMAAVISAEHHEWWDGGGYPRGIKGKEMDISSCIVALADTVGALYSNRPGRKAWQFDKIVQYIEQRKGSQFSPDVVEVFLEKKEHINKILCS